MDRHTTRTLSTLSATTGADRAVVIGAGIGGLLAARVLADHVPHVVVLDRDRLPDGPDHRRHVPHGQHVHALLARGRTIIERLFPGIGAELVAEGAMLGDSRSALVWYQQGGYHHAPRRGLKVLIQSRPLLEHRIRLRVAALPNVTILDGCRVTGLLATRDRHTVTGVRVSSSDAPDVEHELPATLTIDASGRGTRLPAWLAELGVEVPPPVTAGVEARYATRLFRRIPGLDRAPLVTVIVASPETRRGGVMLAQEGDRWLVTLSSRNGQQPPTELSGFIDWARSLEVPDIYDVVRQAVPIDEGVTYRFPQSNRRLYERIKGFPGGLLPFGDSICAFNPVYAQGMTVAAIEAQALSACLTAGTEGLSRRFFASIAPAVETAWMMAASGDLRYADGPIELPRAAQLNNRYMARLLVAVQHDPVVSEAFQRVSNFVDPPAVLRRPAIALRVAFTGRRAARSAPVTPVQPSQAEPRQPSTR